MTEYETVIGLEIHAELATKTKLFCACKNDPFRASEPNIYICPICMALPGTLPVMNRQALEWSALVGLALGCKIGWDRDGGSRYTKWDRKNYFYPDLPKGYQISQYDLPIDYAGGIKIGDKNIEITRIHLEEDTGKLVHPAGSNASLLDYNRAGVPLLELVTEPVIRSGEEAAAFAQMYQLVLRTLGVANADMEKGEMRVEANISVRPLGSTIFGTKVEVKNLNSFKSVRSAIDYETKRQIEALEKGEKLRQETRGWNENKGVTFVQRVKETAADYRYFPEPDLPPVTIDSANGLNLEELNEKLNRIELPWQRQERYIDMGVANQDAERLVFDLAKSDYLDQILKLTNGESAKEMNVWLAKWVVNDLTDQSIEPSHLVELAELLISGEITTKMAKDLLGKISVSSQNPRAIMESEGIVVVRDTGALDQVIQEILQDHAQAVADYRAGKMQAFGFLIGQVMAKTRGQADPSVVKERLAESLKE